MESFERNADVSRDDGPRGRNEEDSRGVGEIRGIDLWPLIVRDTDKVSSAAGPGFWYFVAS